MKKCCFIILSVLLFCVDSQAQSIQILQQKTASSIRGLSVVNDQVAWVSGSGGHVAISTDGGNNWNWQQVKGFETSDFRDIEAFSDQDAIIMSSGTPALILKTTDAGSSWKVVYRNDDKAYFLDAMDFTNSKNGYVLGDPISQKQVSTNKKILLLETNDYGESWHEMSNLPSALPGEGGFAASGTCLRVDGGHIQIVTGGSVSRLITKSLAEKDWKETNISVKHGQESQGAFSISGNKNPVIVGGDYKKYTETDSVTIYSKSPSANALFQKPTTGPAGFQSCVEYLDHQTYLSTGTSGSNITTDGGADWQLINKESFNVCRKAKHGKLVLLAGDKGKIGKFVNH